MHPVEEDRRVLHSKKLFLLLSSWLLRRCKTVEEFQIKCYQGVSGVGSYHCEYRVEHFGFFLSRNGRRFKPHASFTMTSECIYDKHLSPCSVPVHSISNDIVTALIGDEIQGRFLTGSRWYYTKYSNPPQIMDSYSGLSLSTSFCKIDSHSALYLLLFSILAWIPSVAKFGKYVLRIHAQTYAQSNTWILIASRMISL